MEKIVGNKRIFVKDLTKLLTEETILSYFSRYGKITDFEMVKDIEGKPKGFSFITFASSKSTELALEENNNVEGLNLRVELAQPVVDKITNRINCPKTFAVVHLDATFNSRNCLNRLHDALLRTIRRNRKLQNDY